MTREEVAEIIMYCKEHKVTYKSRLAELKYISQFGDFMRASPVMQRNSPPAIPPKVIL